MVTYIGLALIIVGWGIQFLSKEKSIQKGFVLMYLLGVALLSVDAFLGDLTVLAILNLVSFLVAVGVFLNIRK